MTIVTAERHGASWPVKIEKRGDFFSVGGRGTGFNLYLYPTDAGYLVAVPNFNRCGHVPEDCTWRDIQGYVGIANEVDAITLAAAVRFLIGREGENICSCG